MELLIAAGGPIFGPLGEDHRAFWRDQSDICFDDDPDDVRELLGQ